ncbi:MAG: succinate dehydrogenase, hydrophobic membrane anchor protein [Pseudorhodoplanes sp.]
MSHKSSMRTPIARVRHLGSAHDGTDHFWKQRVTSVALVPLTIVFVIIMASLLGRPQATATQIIGSPFVAITLLIFIITGAHHMWLGMQVIIEDYVHGEDWKLSCLIANTFFCFTIAVASIFAILKISFGV